jgi:DNA end-binding protein Ku
MRSMWKGSIGFGLVNIPVRLYVATDESSIPFVQLDKKDHARVRYKKVNENSGRELTQEDIIRAYDMNGNYVIVDDEDFQKAAPEKIDHLEILQFVDEKEIDPVYFEKPYYLEPDKAGVKAYVLLRDALKKEGKAALGPLVYHNKEWVCLIKPMRKVLVMHRLRFSDEIRSEEGLVIPDTQVKAEELKMASLLIAQLTKPFKPQEYRDTYSEKLLGIIEAKARGKVTGKPLKVAHNATTIDLMEKLKASLKATPGGKSATKKAS